MVQFLMVFPKDMLHPFTKDYHFTTNHNYDVYLKFCGLSLLCFQAIRLNKTISPKIVVLSYYN